MKIGLDDLLALAFVVLKLCGVIAWSWWWVTIPAWGPLVLVGLLAGAVAFADPVTAKADRLARKRWKS